MKSRVGNSKLAVRIAGALSLVAVLLLGLGLGSADAQRRNRRDRDRDRDERRQDRHDQDSGHDYWATDGNRRIDIRYQAATNGYSQGYAAGQRDARARKNFNYRDDLGYRNGNHGWNDRWGNRSGDYRTYFRQAFVNGYSDGYYRRARNRSYTSRRGVQVYDYRSSTYDPYYNYPSYSNYSRYGQYYSNEKGDLDRDEVAQRGAQNGYYAGYQRGLYDVQRRARQNPEGHGAFQFGYDGYDPEWGSANYYRTAYRQYFVMGYRDAYARRNYNQTYRRRF